MFSRFLLSCLILLSVHSANSQITFQKIFGAGTYCPYASANSDGTIVCTVDTEGTANYKISSYGNVVWKKNVTIDGNVIPASIRKDFTGGYIFSGTLRDSTGPQISSGLIARLDANGDTISYKTFPPLNDGNYGMIALPTLDGNYILDVYEDGPLLSSSSTLYKLDIGYNTLWSVNSGPSGVSPSGILQDKDSNFIFTNYDPTLLSGINLIKHNNQGVSVLSKSINEPTTCSCFSSQCIMSTKGGGFILGTEFQQQTLLFMLDDNFDTVWTKQLAWGNNSPVSLAYDRGDGGYLLLNYQGKACMYHFDSNGDSIALYQFSPMVTTVGSKMEKCPDGGYIIAGTTYEFDNTSHGFIIKLDSLCRFTPQGHITASGPIEFCFGDSLNLHGPVGNYTYYWSTGEYTPSIVVYNTGSYYLTIIGSSGNSATLNPVNVFSSNPGTPQITNHIDYLEVSAVGSYQWYRNGVPIPGATHDTLQTTLSGNFNVVVTDTVGCVRIAPLFYYSWTGIDEEKTSLNFVYPVPASTEIYMQGNFKNSTINILDVQSKIIRRMENVSGEIFRIDISELPQGVYFLQYDGGEFRKFVVMR